MLTGALPDGANMISAGVCEPDELSFSLEGTTRRGKKVLVVKWTGREADRADERPLDGVYQYFKGQSEEHMTQVTASWPVDRSVLWRRDAHPARFRLRPGGL